MNRILTVDLETDFETKETNSFSLLPRLLDTFDNHDATATFFVVGNLIEKFEDEIKEISKKHEIASHSWSHPRLNTLSYDSLEQEIVKTKEALAKIKIPCKGFRSPFFITHPRQWEILQRHNFLYDSSISSFFPGRYSNLTTPSKPHKHKNLIQLPMPNFIFKAISSGYPWYRLFHPISKIFPLPYMVYLHPCELLKQAPKNNINKLVNHAYTRKLGNWGLLNEFLTKNEGRWLSCEQFINHYNLQA